MAHIHIPSIVTNVLLSIFCFVYALKVYKRNRYTQQLARILLFGFFFLTGFEAVFTAALDISFYFSQNDTLLVDSIIAALACFQTSSAFAVLAAWFCVYIDGRKRQPYLIFVLLFDIVVCLVFIIFEESFANGREGVEQTVTFFYTIIHFVFFILCAGFLILHYFKPSKKFLHAYKLDFSKKGLLGCLILFVGVIFLWFSTEDSLFGTFRFYDLYTIIYAIHCVYFVTLSSSSIDLNISPLEENSYYDDLSNNLLKISPRTKNIN
ncbi:hypothetical protein PCE1_004635 [Barthelona sp. PCE]